MTDSRKNYNEDLHILQINAQRSKAVVDQIKERIVDRCVDIVLIQEPYVVAGRVRGYPGSYRVVQGDLEVCWSAIVVINHDLTITRIDCLCNHFATCVEVISCVGTFYLISLYCQPIVDYGVFLHYLERVNVLLHGKYFIVGMDANANSVLWGGQVSDINCWKSS